MTLDPIAYTYDADHHCPSCTFNRFGATENGIAAGDDQHAPPHDSEGNEIGAVFSWTEWHEPSDPGCQFLVCSDCGTHIDEHHIDPDEVQREAGQLGRADGRGAASWLVDGNTDDPAGVLARLYSGIQDGDPEILDQLPQPDLSMQWANGRDAYDFFPVDTCDACIDAQMNDACQEYEDEFAVGVEYEIQETLDRYREDAR